MKAKLFIASGALAAMVWAAPLVGAAHYIARRGANEGRTLAQEPLAARFRVENDRGLLLRIWLNGSGPYVFALDTGAGMNVIAQRVVTEIKLPTKAAPSTYVGGLTSSRIVSNREAIINQMAVGERGNALPSSQTALIVTNLPLDIDGIIDPTQAYAPLGYSIDLPNEQIEALGAEGVLTRPQGSEGAVVAWIRKPDDARPFVRLGDGRLALLDTGSRFGLAVNERNAVIVGNNRENGNVVGRDIAGGIIRSRRVSPTTISIGELVLRRIPTDILFGVHEGAPLILGRDALYPFKISFDPRRRLIAFVASSQNSD